MGTRPQLRGWFKDSSGRLVGRVYGDPRWPDGTKVHTSPVLNEWRMGAARIVRTGRTEYELVKLDGRPWYAD